MTILSTLPLVFACGGDDVKPDSGLPDAVVQDTGSNPDDMDGDGWTDANDNCPAAANPEQRDRDSDGVGNVCDSCPSTPNDGTSTPAQNACEFISETEPNDIPGEGEAVVIAPTGNIREVRGVIEPPTGDGQTYDRFQIMVPGQTLLRVRVARAQPESLLEPAIVVSGGGFTIERTAHGLFVASREVYFAEAGVYEVAVTDRRGLFGDSPRGSSDFAYALALETAEVEPQAIVAPLDARPFELRPSGAVVVLEGPVGPGSPVRIETETGLGQGATEGIDTILIVERNGGADVTENDNLGMGFTDSRLLLDLAAEESIRVILDHRQIFGDDPEVRLTVDVPTPGVELEPNDRLSLASPLIFPGLSEGRINAPRSVDEGPPDIDWFKFEGTAGQVAAFNGILPAASSADTVFRLAVENGTRLEVLYENFDSSAKAPRIEAILPETRTYYLIVTDQLNEGDPPYRGNDAEGLFDYSIFSETLGVQVVSTLTSTGTLNGTINSGGRVVRHLLQPSGPTIVDFTLGGVGAPEFLPYGRLYGPQIIGVLSEGAVRFTGLLAEVESYVVGVHNTAEGAASPTFTYEYGVRFIPVPVVANEAEPNDAVAAANPLGTLPVAASGEASAPDDLDHFTFEAADGAVVTLSLGRAEPIGNVSIYDDTGTELIAGPGRIDAFAVPAAGTYTVRVNVGEARPYDLVVFE